MFSSGPPTYKTLSFSAILDEDHDASADTVPWNWAGPPTSEIPLAIDLDFDFEFEGRTLAHTMPAQQNSDDVEMRSPRSPTFSNRSPLSPNANSPFDPSRFFMLPLDPPSPDELSPLSPRQSPTAKMHLDLDILHDESKENVPPISPPSTRPLAWIWICHLCHSRYPLGVTRRCLVDGHYYCSGDSSSPKQRNVKRKKKNQSCSSEFDYTGWRAWGDWKRQRATTEQQTPTGTGQTPATLRLRGCEACDYPSQCHYEKLNQRPDVIPVSPPKTTDNSDGDDASTEQMSSTQRASKKNKKYDLTVDTGSPPVDEYNVDHHNNKRHRHSSARRKSRSDGTQTESVPEKPANGVGDGSTDIDHRGDDRSPGWSIARDPDNKATSVSVDGSSLEGAKNRGHKLLDRSWLKQSRISDFFGVSKQGMPATLGSQ